MSAEPESFDETMERIGALLQGAERTMSAPALAAAQSLWSAVLSLHRGGLAAILDVVAHDEHGTDLRHSMESDTRVASLLLLHGLHSEPVETRARRAVRQADTRAKKRGSVELVGFSEGRPTVRVRYHDPQRRAELMALVEEELQRIAPECEPVFEATALPSSFIPLERLTEREGTP
jgi:hypothetical protein